MKVINGKRAFVKNLFSHEIYLFYYEIIRCTPAYAGIFVQ